jgi:hypothetical protein
MENYESDIHKRRLKALFLLNMIIRKFIQKGYYQGYIH